MKLIVAFPLGESGWPGRCVPYHIQIVQRCTALGIPILPTIGYVDENRNQSMIMARNAGATHVLMLDADHRHPPDIVDTLVKWMRDGRMVVAGLNFQRGGHHRPLFGIITEDGRREPITEWSQRLVKCDWVATCAMLINLKVMDLWPAPWFWFSYKGTDHYGADLKWVGEDINFCTKLHEHGVPVYVDTQCQSPHKALAWADEDYWRLMKPTADEETSD